MCWDPRPTGVFNSTECGEEAKRLIAAVDEAWDETLRPALDAKGFIVAGPSDDLSEVAKLINELAETKEQLRKAKTFAEEEIDRRTKRYSAELAKLRADRHRRASWIFGPLLLTTMAHSEGARLIDRGWSTTEDGRKFDILAVRLFSEKLPGTALVIGWEGRSKPKMTLNWREKLRLLWRLGAWHHCPACNDDAPAVDSCIVCCGRAQWLRGNTERSWKPTNEERETLTHRYFRYCTTGTTLDWDPELSYGHPPPPPRSLQQDMCAAAEAIVPHV